MVCVGRCTRVPPAKEFGLTLPLKGTSSSWQGILRHTLFTAGMFIWMAIVDNEHGWKGHRKTVL